MAANPAVVETPLLKKGNAAPTRKVAAGAIAGALTTVLVFFLNTYVLPANQPITGDIGAALTMLLSFLISYVVPSAVSDQVSAG